MSLPLYIVDAFTTEAFKGNPAAVCPLNDWLDDTLLQSIARQHNLSETAFIVGNGNRYRIRWFTPSAEVDLCGHATLASAFVVKSFLHLTIEEILFESKSGDLFVTCNDGVFALDFPSLPVEAIDPVEELARLLKVQICEFYQGPYFIAVLENEKAVTTLQPDFSAISRLTGGKLIITAKGDHCDFVSRFFAPAFGVNEDPVTGSAHCLLTPFWAERLGKPRLTARQVGPRTGELICEHKGERTMMIGKARLYAKGEIFL